MDLKPFQIPAPHITRADRPASELAAAIQATVARQKVQARDERLREILAHPETAEKPGTAGELAEQRHWLLDADPDSTIRQFVNLTKGKPGRAS
ncbi:hypothetical protein ABT150_23050 [Streptomyces mirabilis]|uniref:hypothetical protein n=1 Tax=Streptomyces mirabilis TaxID=68239 RepID=UPI00331B17B8